MRKRGVTAAQLREVLFLFKYEESLSFYSFYTLSKNVRQLAHRIKIRTMYSIVLLLLVFPFAFYDVYVLPSDELIREINNMQLINAFLKFSWIDITINHSSNKYCTSLFYTSKDYC